jgi:hypothetical protein
MYTWVLRTAAICLAVLPAIASCAGDDDAPPASTVNDSCTPNMSSLSLGMAMSADDPCGPQPAGSPCDPAKGHIAYAMCGADGKWAKDPMKQTSIKCDCMTCGNRVVESIYGEQCEPNQTTPMPTCAQMTGKAASTGTITCSPSCALQVNCTNPTPPPPPQGGSGG